MDLSGCTPDQRRAIRHLDGPALICAGAGTGKTFTLTQRLAWALSGDPESGTPPFLNSIDEVLVITYTDKAAAELKSRFRTALKAEGLEEDALKVDGAWVSTIHGMCSRILREHALELGLDPNFKLALGSAVESARLEAVNAALQDPEDYLRFQPLFDEYGTAGLESMLDTMLTQASCRTDGMDAFRLGPAPDDPAEHARAALDLAVQLAGSLKNKTGERAALAAELLQSYLTAQDRPCSIAEIRSQVNPGRMSGKSDAIARFREELDAARWLESFAASYPLMELLLELARKVESLYRQILARRSFVDTSDLIRTTMRVFENHPDLADSYTGRFRLIMVDEFQDTSQLQVDMISRIAGADSRALCTVGDAQQSIYRFQGADVEVYLGHKRDMEQRGALMVQLNDNFRSNGDILAFVRRVCGQPGYFAESFLDLRAAGTGRAFRGEAPRVELSLTLYDSGCSRAAVEHEARLIARRFRALADEGNSPGDMAILMGSTANMQVYADALRREGLACMAQSGSKFYQADHVQRCLSLLRVLANPYDSASMMDVLSSDVLPVSSEDLLLLSTYENEETGALQRQNFAVGLLSGGDAPAGASPLLEHALRVLRRAVESLGSMRPSKLFLSTIVDTGWLDRLSRQGIEGQSTIADILKFTRKIEEAEREAGTDMVQVSLAMDASALSDKEKPGVLSVRGRRAVRLMTVHGSKGLEFPIVAVTNCFTSRKDAGALRCAAGGNAIYASLLPKEDSKASEFKCAVDFGEDIDLSAYADQTVRRGAILELEQRREEAEQRRLFYVATTRASDALIVAVHKQRTKTLRYREVEADLLSSLFPDSESFPEQSGRFDYGGSEPGVYTFCSISQEERDDVSVPEPAAETADGIDDASGTVAIPDAAERAKPDLQPASQRRGFFSYSSISDHDAAKPRNAEPADADGDGPAGLAQAAPRSFDADKATDFGTALHRTCEWEALHRTGDETEVGAAALRFARTYGVRDTDRLLRAVGRWLHSDIAARCYAQPHCEPELPFCCTAADGILEGEIDLICSDGSGRALIVDYKTGGSPSETPEQLRGKHLLQARCYAYSALKAGFAGVELHFVRVEQADPERPDQPQIVSYAFSSEDLPELECAIAQARKAQAER